MASFEGGAPSGSLSAFMQFDEGGAREFLCIQKWPTGLQDTFVRSVQAFPLRFFICDDSGSMATTDGSKLVNSNGHMKEVSCSRWTELTDSLRFHVKLAQAARAPTEFRLLNNCPPVCIGTGDNAGFDMLMNAFSQSPSGGTPLCTHIREITEKIKAIEGQLRSNGKKACIIIATDGEASDGNLADVMRPLKDLPVWVVVRLCTSESNVVKYWNNIDNELELNMDVLDDIGSEAQEVHEHNPWLTYGEPLHRLREFGIQLKELDLIDEGKLSLENVLKCTALIYGGRPEDYPNPQADFRGFLDKLTQINAKVGEVYNPVEKVPKHWMRVVTLKKNYGGGGCSIM